MRAVDLPQIADSDIILSIVPPSEALPLAHLFAPAIAETTRKPVYADCNAVSPQNVQVIAGVITESHSRSLGLAP